jgi:hypothetical protein
VIAAVTAKSREGVTVKVTLGEPAKVPAPVQRTEHDPARRVYPTERPTRVSTVRVQAAFGAGRLVVKVLAVDAAGNKTTKIVRVTVL